MYRLQVKTHFDAAHYIKDYPGKCSRLHGHRWEVEVVLEGERLDRMNMLVDFVEVKRMLDELLDTQLDHYLLNETLGEKNVTAEFLAEWLFKRIFYSSTYAEIPAKLTRVTVWESPDCCVKYFGEE